MRILYVMSLWFIVCASMNSNKLYKYVVCLDTADEMTVSGFCYTGNYDKIYWNKETDTFSGESSKQCKWDKSCATVLGLPDEKITVLSEGEARGYFRYDTINSKIIKDTFS